MPEPESIEYKGKIVGRIGQCTLISVPGTDGQEHLEATCQSKEARDHLAAILEQEAVLRVNPKVVLDDTPPAAPATPEPDTRLNPSES